MKASLNLVWAVIFLKQVVGEYGMAHFRNKGQSKGKDYCIFFNSQWARLPQHLNKASRLQIYDLTPSVLCSSSDVPEGGFPNRIPMVMRGNCTFYEKVRLAQLNGAKGLLIISKDRLETRLSMRRLTSLWRCSATLTCWTSVRRLDRAERRPCTPRASLFWTTTWSSSSSWLWGRWPSEDTGPAARTSRILQPINCTQTQDHPERSPSPILNYKVLKQSEDPLQDIPPPEASKSE
ncbi:uncharacterized protein LOC112226582 isoform X1 [Oncorhynchus tshawytscha]|uniref:uncharacterized protein LOC112226582 isoform X1 n=1 Tax=Oncorhynchus tshawytscha TaxID=74940 RepID=UPI001C3DC9D1|nr:uncharacterized protein LOC112226582 isoform X1 [Oncorhynchus tshawytscha]